MQKEDRGEPMSKKISQRDIRDAYRERYQQTFGTLQELLDMYGYTLYDNLIKKASR